MGNSQSGSIAAIADDERDAASDAARDTSNYEGHVGRNHPPEWAQFRKGQPRPEGAGRRKGTLNRSTMQRLVIKFFFEATVVVKSKDGTSSRTIPRIEALLTTGYDRANKGSSRDLKTLLELILRFVDDEQDADDQLARMISELSKY